MKGEELYSLILGNMDEGVYFVDAARKITFWNKGAERITGYLESEVVGHFCFDNILRHVNDSGVQLCLHGCPLHKTLSDGNLREASVYLHHKLGHRVPVLVKALPMTENGKVIGAVELFSDKHDLEELESNLENLKVLAMKDQLTNLANRRYIEIFLKGKMEELESLGIPFGMIFIDIDRFKRFNDSYGHEVGDRVLKMVSRTIAGIVSATDLIGRWGGEEFIGIFSGVSEVEMWTLSEKIRMLVEHSSFEIDEQSLHVTISLGTTVIDHPCSLDEAVNRVDQLMYASKEKGRNQVTLG
ncbi:sensor domain-containing diguanylate cyclase [uncultured Sphaerochaeta sp.]|uniref:sensor domain-containing diguanylate cyclase n=1 Tax=uncultured Sphaerochaeta sp. TaxID=886478 RepID=UPI002A0A1E07|nr:sensor domain-containing diguanylate cyclase [uncultured Sphaerochaeta sp.]